VNSGCCFLLTFLPPFALIEYTVHKSPDLSAAPAGCSEQSWRSRAAHPLSAEAGEHPQRWARTGTEDHQAARPSAATGQ